MTSAQTGGEIFAQGFFGRLRRAAEDQWRGYVGHEFVRALGDGSLPQAAFRHYLIQDYLFLIQFARAWALAAYKSDTMAEMRAAAAAMSGIVDVEMKLHVGFCAQWGLSEAELERQPEAPATVAYTRYVLDRGNSGDLLDLQVALAPCIVGYGEIGAQLLRSARLVGNPYRSWIEMYGGPEYQAVAQAAVVALDASAAKRGGAARFASLARNFAMASLLEADFWQMALDAGR
jgi:thiaminase/transcriptional activator TenA